MGKVTDNALATLISSRITEIMNQTGLSLNGLANFAGLTAGPLRSHYNKTLTITVEHVAKICSPFSIPLADFFNPKIALVIDTDNLPSLSVFKEITSAQEQNFLLKQKIDPANETVNEDLRRQRELIAYVVYASDYFTEPRTLEQMVDDFHENYKINFSTERIYSLLRKYVGHEVLQRKPLPKPKCKGSISKRPFLYFKSAAETQGL
ncbi:hypothetical protein [Sphingobacterium detergens]|uniref:Uncharacterized protein n=1 Tax=Sphingobacterium detergens TaxID=1145106 RepID=A0A420ALJ8_SPHD1|nr:hypothetical protein [Sphingobacterium detergens]RKE45331.1 hypothetical protein DFQ12_4403 [Sphingobacterium detergens]